MLEGVVKFCHQRRKLKRRNQKVGPRRRRLNENVNSFIMLASPDIPA
jgi:hypothetical protein